MVGDCRAQGLEPAVNRGARLLLLALGIRDLPGDVAKFARGLDDRRELRDICRRSKRFDLRCDLGQLLVGLGHGGSSHSRPRRLRAASIEQGPKDRDLGLGRNARNQLIDVAGPFKFGGKAIEGCFRGSQFRAALGQVRLPRANLDAAIMELLRYLLRAPAAPRRRSMPRVPPQAPRSARSKSRCAPRRPLRPLPPSPESWKRRHQTG